MSTEVAAIQVLADYYAAFSTLDPQAFLPYFHEPSLAIGPQGIFAAPTHAILATALAPAIEDFKARGYCRSELRVHHTQALSATATIATGVAIRYKADGDELERVGVTYVLHKTDHGWKIAVMILHDQETVIQTTKF
jgi:hypothetical protein